MTLLMESKPFWICQLDDPFIKGECFFCSSLSSSTLPSESSIYLLSQSPLSFLMMIIFLTQNPDDCRLLAYFAFALYMFCLFFIFCIFCMFCMLMMIIKSLRILIIAGLWHIATALANLLTGYILQVKGILSPISAQLPY